MFLGIFATIAASWVGIVLASNLQLGELEPATSALTDLEGNAIEGVFYQDPETEALRIGINQEREITYPQGRSGSAQRGKRVYEQLGCIYCHSQQVRREGFGSDFERGWGQRQSVARDYIYDDPVLLGTMRTGPDLANVGLRYSRLWQYQHLYNPQITSPGSIMPPYAFLFEVRAVSPRLGPSPEAVLLPEAYALPQGYELIPTQRADDLVDYLMSLNQNYDLPEAKRAF